MEISLGFSLLMYKDSRILKSAVFWQVANFDEKFCISTVVPQVRV